MTLDELVQRAKRRLAALPESSSWNVQEIALYSMVPAAIHELAVKVMYDDALRGLLQQEYDVALDPQGVGDLLTAVGSITGLTGEILQEGIYLGVVLDADKNILVPLKHYQAFLSPQATVYAYYNLSDKVIRTRAIDLQVTTPLDIVGVTGPLLITASYAPANVTDIPVEIEDDLVGVLVEVAIRKGPAIAG